MFCMLEITIYSAKLSKIDQINNNSIISDAIAYQLHQTFPDMYSMGDIKVHITSQHDNVGMEAVRLIGCNATVRMRDTENDCVPTLLRAEMYDAINTTINRTLQHYDAKSTHDTTSIFTAS